MSWAEEAAGVYSREECARSFREDVEAHLMNPRALVVSCARVFALVRPVRRDWPGEWVVDPWRNENELTCAPDCWHIYLVAGDIRAIFSFPHEPLPWVSFERGNVLRFHRYERIARLCATIQTATVRIGMGI